MTTIKCRVCGDLKRINFNENKIFHLKEEAEIAKEIADQNYLNLSLSYVQMRKQQKIVRDLQKLKQKLIKEVYQYIKDIEIKSKNIKNKL